MGLAGKHGQLRGKMALNSRQVAGDGVGGGSLGPQKASDEILQTEAVNHTQERPLLEILTPCYFSVMIWRGSASAIVGSHNKP